MFPAKSGTFDRIIKKKGEILEGLENDLQGDRGSQTVGPGSGLA